VDFYQNTLVGITTEWKGLTEGGNGLPIIKKGPTIGKGRTVIWMEKKAMMVMVKLMMTSMRSAFWSAMVTSLMS